MQNEQMLLGQPVEKIKRIVSKASKREFGAGPLHEIVDKIATELGVTIETAQCVFHDLQSEGYIEVQNRLSYYNRLWFVKETEKGKSLLDTQVMKALTPNQAKDLYYELLHKVYHINSSDDFLYLITEIWFQECYWGKKELPNGLDVAVSFECKISGEGISKKSIRKLYESIRAKEKIPQYELEHYAPLKRTLNYITNFNDSINLYINGAFEMPHNGFRQRVYSYYAQLELGKD